MLWTQGPIPKAGFRGPKLPPQAMAVYVLTTPILLINLQYNMNTTKHSYKQGRLKLLPMAMAAVTTLSLTLL
jgi:hypothetical protein